MRTMRISFPIMCPPSTPISAAILPCACARRTSSAVRANTMSFENLRTFSCTASIWSSAFCTAAGPMIRPSIQMEKKMAFIPPSRIRGMSMCPSGLRLPRSKLFEKKRCVVSSCVSSTIEEKCNLCARSAISSPLLLHSARKIEHAYTTTYNKPRSRCISPRTVDVRKSLPYKPAQQSLFPRLPINLRQRFRQRNLFRAGLHAILRVRAILDAAVPHHRLNPLFGMHPARWMHIKESHLAENRRAHKIVVLVNLRADFQAVSATNAARKRVSLLLNFRRYARPLAQIVCAVNRNPRLHPLQALEHELPVHRQIAHHGKFDGGPAVH